MPLLPLTDQYNQVMNQPDMRARVDAAVALTAIVDIQNPSADPTVQAQRLRLINDILIDSKFYTEVFAWFQLTNPSNTTIEAITDLALISTVQTNFDKVAALLYPTP